MSKLRVGIIGATGLVGQTYVELLKNHPWFELVYKAASTQRGDLQSADPTVVAKHCDLVFICADVDETAYAKAGLLVIAHGSALRHHPEIPLIIPEINGEQIALVDKQKWPGKLVAKPNCSVQSYLLPLYPLHERFGLKKVMVTTMQALSGGGRDLLERGIGEQVVHEIAGEEEKCEREPLKILGREIPFSVQCNRIPIPHGHSASVSVEFEVEPTRNEILAAWREFRGLDLPSAPSQPILYQEPLQLHGMEVSTGFLRPCPLFHWRFVGLSHNLIRGAAGGGLLSAELLVEHAQSKSIQAPRELSLSRS